MMSRLLIVSSDQDFTRLVSTAVPSSIEQVVSNGELESIVAEVRRGDVSILWDLATEWVTPRMILELVSSEHIQKNRWFWARHEHTDWKDVPSFGDAFALPMAPELIVSRIFDDASKGPESVSGGFESLSLPDLLQTMAMNQRDVRVTLDFEGSSGSIDLVSGFIAQVQYRDHVGIKALCRILDEHGGLFSMSPLYSEPGAPLLASVNEALMMAVQFKDEKANLLDEYFGSLGVVLKQDSSVTVPVGEAGKEAELWRTLEVPRTLRSLLEMSPLADAIVLKTCRDWLEIGALTSSNDLSAMPTLSSILERYLGTWQQDGESKEIASICANAEQLERLRATWSAIDGFIPSSKFGTSQSVVHLGDLHHFKTNRRIRVTCWGSDGTDLRPWARWRKRETVFVVHPDADESLLGQLVTQSTGFAATREVGLEPIEILRGLERVLARVI